MECGVGRRLLCTAPFALIFLLFKGYTHNIMNIYSFCASRATLRQQTILSDVQNALRNSNVEVEKNEISSCAFKRPKDETKDDDDAQLPSKKPHHSGRGDLCTSVERTKSSVLTGRADLDYSSCVRVSDSSDCWQARPRAFHRPFETASSVGHRSESDVETEEQSSPSVGVCQSSDDRRDVTSWADCLRQLATALRRREVADDSGPAVGGPVTGALDHTTPGSQRPPEKRRDADVVQDDHLQSADDEECNSVIITISNNNNNLSVSKFDTPATDCHCSLSFNAAAVQDRPSQGLNSLSDTHTHSRRFSVVAVYYLHVSFYYYAPPVGKGAIIVAFVRLSVRRVHSVSKFGRKFPHL